MKPQPQFSHIRKQGGYEGRISFFPFVFFVLFVAMSFYSNQTAAQPETQSFSLNEGSTAKQQADFAIQLILQRVKAAQQAPIGNQTAAWKSVDQLGDQFRQRWTNHPWQLLIDLQLALGHVARGESTRLLGPRALPTAIKQFRVAKNELVTIINSLKQLDQNEAIAPGQTSSTLPLTRHQRAALLRNVQFQLAKTLFAQSACYPSGNTDRTNLLQQAIEQLEPLTNSKKNIGLARQSQTLLKQCNEALQTTTLEMTGTNTPGMDAEVLAIVLQAEAQFHAGELAGSLIQYETALQLAQQKQLASETIQLTETAAAIEKKLGRTAAAVARLRQVAQAFPMNPKASGLHRSAILLVADQLRAKDSTEQADWLSQYEQLLTEHLEHWPDASSASEVRLWLAKFFLTKGKQLTALELLRQIPSKSPHYSQAIRAMITAYQTLIGTIKQPKEAIEVMGTSGAKHLPAARRDLQFVITGTENRWPRRWSILQLECALALAEHHLHCDRNENQVASRLLTVALENSATNAPPEVAAWRNRAQLLLCAALVQEKQFDLASKTLANLTSATASDTASLLKILAQQLEKTRDIELGQLALKVCDQLININPQLNTQQNMPLLNCRSIAWEVTGQTVLAISAAEALHKRNPRDYKLHASYARLLASTDNPAQLETALREWHKIERGCKPGEPRWVEARTARLELLVRLDQTTKARKLLQLTRLLHPNLGGTEWQRRMNRIGIEKQ